MLSPNSESISAVKVIGPASLGFTNKSVKIISGLIDWYGQTKIG